MRFKAPSYHKYLGVNAKERNKISAGGSKFNRFYCAWLAVGKKNHNGSVSIRKSQLDFLMRLRRTLKELHIII